jgi:uncharacterized membrane protein
VADRSTAPPYSEEQATAWLAWLAYHMRCRDLTIFQIENLQPDWLVGHPERVSHLLITRTLWGVWAGLLGGLIGGLLVGLGSGLMGGLIAGVIAGLSGGLLEVVTPIHKLDAPVRSRRSLTGFFTGTIIFGVIGGLSVGLIGALTGKFVFGK